jgi:hypothetical protein
MKLKTKHVLLSIMCILQTNTKDTQYEKEKITIMQDNA